MRRIAMLGAMVLVAVFAFIGPAVADGHPYMTPPGETPNAGTADSGSDTGTGTGTGSGSLRSSGSLDAGGGSGGSGGLFGRLTEGGWLAFTGVALGALAVLGGGAVVAGKFMRHSASAETA